MVTHHTTSPVHLRVLVACEFSGVVRDAFRGRGHDAMSCDLLPTERPGPHYKGDVRDILGDGWDMMIAHPPCTHLAVSGARWFPQKRADGRQSQAVAFFMLLANAPIPRIAIENPVCIMSNAWRRPDQIINPNDFGHNDTKTTCLWLKNVPPLFPTRLGPYDRYRCRCGHEFPPHLGKYGCPDCCGSHGAARGLFANQTQSGQNNLPPSESRAHERSKTYQGIADAMAEQWGALPVLTAAQGGAA